MVPFARLGQGRSLRYYPAALTGPYSHTSDVAGRDQIAGALEWRKTVGQAQRLAAVPAAPNLDRQKAQRQRAVLEVPNRYFVGSAAILNSPVFLLRSIVLP